MTDNEILTVLKVDLQLSTDKLDPYLLQLIGAAKSYIAVEGIALTCSSGDGMLVKRPLVVGEDFVLTGFKEAEWKEKLGACVSEK